MGEREIEAALPGLGKAGVEQAAQRVDRLVEMAASEGTAKRIALGMLWLCGMPFALGVLNMILKATLDDADATENRIEWISALSMQAYFVLIYFAWRDTGFTVSVRNR